LKLTDISEVRTVSIIIALIAVALSTFETSVYFYDITWPCIPEVHRRFRCAYCIIIALIVQAVSTDQMSVYFNEVTRPSIPEGWHLHTRRYY
jgi:hypothetical protein